MSEYVIRGGEEGRKRLGLLGRVLWPTTSALLRRAGLAPGMSCLDLGCGGGDVALEMAALVGPGGKVVGLDRDQEKLAHGRREAAERGLANLELRSQDVLTWNEEAAYDFVYSRFLLTHLREPAALLVRMWQALRPGGRVVIEDIDFRGHFSFPRSAAFDRYVELYRAVVARRGADADIGPRLHAMARAAGWTPPALEVIQPAFVEGEGKEMAVVTLENIADAVVADGLAGREELERQIAELRLFTGEEGSLISLPRIFQLWSRRN